MPSVDDAELQRLREDLLDIALATARVLTAGPERYSLDGMLWHFGYTREQIRELPEEIPPTQMQRAACTRKRRKR